MIIPDINLLVYSYNSGVPRHLEAKVWWEDLVNGSQQIGIPWVVASGFVRIMTHPKIMPLPMHPL